MPDPLPAESQALFDAVQSAANYIAHLQNAFRALDEQNTELLAQVAALTMNAEEREKMLQQQNTLILALQEKLKQYEK